MAERRRRIMRALKINEISGVDSPAQEGAVAVIMKRRDDVGKASVLTSPEEGHSHLLALNGPPDGVELNSGFTSFEEDHRHPWVRMPGGEIVIGTARAEGGNPHIHRVAFMSKDDDQTAGGTGTVVDGGDKTMATNDKDKATEELVAKAADLQKQLDRAESINALSGPDRAHFEGLEGDAQDAFLAKSADERRAEVDAVVKAAADEDPVVYTTRDGVELRKSVGAGFVAMAKSNDALRDEVTQLRDERVDSTFEKRAETELSHIPGDVKTRAAMLKALDGIEDEDQREAALNALKAQNESMGKAFETHGHDITPAPGSPADELDGLAKAHREAHSDLSPEQAYDAVLKTERGAELYSKSVN